MDETSDRLDGGDARTASMSPLGDHSAEDSHQLSIPAAPLPPPPTSASYSALQLSPGLGSQAACLSESMPPFLPPEVTSLFSGLMKQRRVVGCRKGRVWMRPVANGAKEWKEQAVELDSSRAALSLLPSAPGQPILTYPLTGVRVLRIVEGHPAPSTRGDLGEEEGPRRPQSELSFELQLGQGGPRHQVCGVTRAETTEWLEALSRETQSEPVTLRVEGSMERVYGRGPDGDEESEWSSGSEASVFSDGEHVCAYKRKELIRSHLQKPRIPVRKLDLLCRWVSCMRIWPTPVEVETLAKDLSNGLLLCGLMERLVPGTKYVGLHKRPISRGSAMYNLEEALAIIWRTRKVNNTLVPSSEDLYHCKHNKAAWLLAEIFEAYVMSDIRKRASRILEWFNSVLQQYDRHLSGEPWNEMQDGASLFCVLFHFCGPNVVGTKALVRKIDARRVYSNPKDNNQIRANVQEVLLILKALNIKVPWTLDAWIAFLDQDFLLYTLDAIHDRFASKDCVLPTAQRGVIGLATKPDGSRRVVGMVFADSQETRSAAPASTSKDPLATDMTGGARIGGAPRSPQRDATEAAKASTAAERRSRGDLERRWNASVSTEIETRHDEKLSPRQALQALKHDNGCMEAVLQATLGNICVVNKDEHKVAMIRDAIETAKRQKEIHSDRIDVELRLVEQHAVKLDAQKDHLPPNSYDESIAQLQRKRYQLYKESVQLEHAFQERMAQMEKAMSRTKAGQDGQRRNGASSPTRSKESRLSLSERERRWIKFTRPSHTYNTMIKRLQRVSEDQTEHMMEQERSVNRKVIGNGTGAQPAAPLQLSLRPSVRKSAKLVTPKGAWTEFKARMRSGVHETDEVVEQPPEAATLESPRPYTGRAELTDTIAQIRQAAPQRRQQQQQVQAQSGHDKVSPRVDVMSDVESAAEQYWRAVAADRAKDLAAVPAQPQQLARAASPPRSTTPPPPPPLPATQALAPAPSSTVGVPKPASPRILGPHPSLVQPQQTTQQQPMTEPSALPARQADQHATAPLSQTASTPALPSRTEPMTSLHAQAHAPPQPATQPPLPPPPPPPAPSAPLARDTSSSVVQPSMSWQARATGLNQQDRNALLRWLMVSRRLVLQERNYERTFDFSVVPLSSVSALASRAGGTGQYAFKWSLGAKRLAGFVALPNGVSKLRLAEKDPSSFVIVLRDDTDVVRSSGGLRTLMIKAENPEDASKYLVGMALFNVAPGGA